MKTFKFQAEIIKSLSLLCRYLVLQSCCFCCCLVLLLLLLLLLSPLLICIFHQK